MLLQTDPSVVSLRRHTLVLFLLSAILLVCVGGWAATASLASAVIANGKVGVESNTKKVQHLSGGIVAQINVSEGETVKSGQLLIKLDEATARAQLSIAEGSLARLYVRRARLRAERAGDASFSLGDDVERLSGQGILSSLKSEELKYFDDRKITLGLMKGQLDARKAQLSDEISGLDVQIRAYEDSLKLITDQAAHVDGLFSKKLAVLQQVNSVKLQQSEIASDLGERIALRAQAKGKISELDIQIVQLAKDRSAEVSKELTDVEAQVVEAEQQRLNAVTQLSRLDIVAPTNGKVLQLSVHTIGGVVSPGEPLMYIVPDLDTLTVEAKIGVSDVDKVHLGQPVDIRFSAFDQRTTPEVSGVVTSVAPDAVRDDVTGAYYYAVRVLPQPDSLKKLGELTLHPGMPAEVFIKISDRIALSYFLKPLKDQLQHAMRED